MSPLNIEVRAEIDDLERRKAALGDLSAINADYARSEAQHAALADEGIIGVVS